MIRTTIVTASLAMVTLAAPAQAGETTMPEPVWMTRPCAQEDSLNCYWDAGNMGNGVGHSFYSIKVGREMCTVYVQNKYARKHNTCTAL